MRVFIPGDVIVDGDIAIPLVGAVIPAMGVCLLTDGIVGDDRASLVEGVVTWSRFDARSGLTEAVVTTDTCAMLTRANSTGGTEPEVGATISVRGDAICVRTYEFEAFQLPDVSQAWRISEVIGSDIDGYLVDVDPVTFRTQGASPKKD